MAHLDLEIPTTLFGIGTRGGQTGAGAQRLNFLGNTRPKSLCLDGVFRFEDPRSDRLRRTDALICWSNVSGARYL